MGPSTYARVAEITSGRAISQQGLTATCKDRVHKEESEARGGVWSGAWARRSDEGGVIPSEATHEVAPTWGNTPGGQRGPGHWVANEPGPWEDMTGTAWYNLSSGGRSWWRTSRPEGKPMGRCTTHLPSPITWDVSWSPRRGGGQTVGARGVCGSALKLPHRWAGPRSDKWCAEPRSEPDSGNPTVRDRRAALRIVTSLARGGLVRALNFEPDNRMHGLTGGSWKRHTDRTRATEMKDPRGNLAVTSGSETYRRCASPRQLSTLLPRRNRHRPILAAPHQVNNLTMPSGCPVNHLL
jgi:hypothetical protein